MRLATKIAWRTAHGRIVSAILVVATMLVVAFAFWLETAKFSDAEIHAQLAGHADAVARTSETVETISEVDELTARLRKIAPTAKIAVVCGTDLAVDEAPALGASVQVFDYGNELLDGMVDWHGPKSKQESSVAISTGLSEKLNLKPGDTISVGGKRLSIDALFSRPALPAVAETLVTPEAFRQTWGENGQIGVAHWFTAGIPNGAWEQLPQAGFRLTPVEISIQSSEFPDPRLPFGSAGVIAGTAIVFLICLLLLGRMDQRDVTALKSLGVGRRRQIRIAAGVYFIRAVPLLVGVLGGALVAKIALTVTSHLSGLDYGDFSIDWAALGIWGAVIALLVFPYLGVTVWEPPQVRSYRHFSRIGTSLPWTLRLPLRDSINQRWVTVASVIGLSGVVALTVAALTIVNMMSLQYAALEAVPKPDPSIIRIEIGSAALSPQAITDLEMQHDADVTELAWASFPQKGDYIDQVALRTPVLDCSKAEYAASSGTKIYDRRHCLRQANDFLPDKLAVVATIEELQRLTATELNAQQQAQYRNHVACVGVSCPATIELTGLSEAAPVVKTPAITLDAPALGLGMPQLFIDPQLAQELGIETNGAAPLPDGTLFPSRSANRSLVVKPHTGVLDLTLLMQKLRSVGVEAPSIETPQQQQVAQTRSQFILGASLLAAVMVSFFALLAHAQVVRMSQATRQLLLLGEKRLRLRKWTAMVLLAQAALPLTVGVAIGLVASYFFLKANEQQAYFGLSPYLWLTLVVTAAALAAVASRAARNDQRVTR